MKREGKLGCEIAEFLQKGLLVLVKTHPFSKQHGRLGDTFFTVTLT